MKIKPEDYQELKQATKDFCNAQKDFVLMLSRSEVSFQRKVWDLYHKVNFIYSCCYPLKPSFTVRLYTYLNDDNIESAMKSIIKELKLF